MTRIDQMGRNDAERLIHATIEIEALTDALEDMVDQFGYVTVQRGERLVQHTGGLSALEHAFDVLGWDDPHPIPERECDEPGCHEEATCGVLTDDGYRRLCGAHHDAITRKDTTA